MLELLAIGGNHAVFKSECSTFVLRLRLARNLDAESESKFLLFVRQRWFSSRYIDDPIVVSVASKSLNSAKFGESCKYSLVNDSGLVLPNYFSLSRRVFEIKPKWSGSLFPLGEICTCKYCSHPKRAEDKSQFCPKGLYCQDFDLFHSALVKYPFRQCVEPEDLYILAHVLFKDGIMGLIQNAHKESVDRAPLICNFPTGAEFYPYLMRQIESNPDDPLLLFMASFAVRDCSIFIIIDDVFVASHSFVVCNDRPVSYQIKLIDFDLKDSSRIPKYIDEIRRYYTEVH